MFIDPAISRAKFQRELNEFRAQRTTYHERGVWLMDDTFPELFFVLMTVKSFPISAVFGLLINFENYDIEPPSIKFVNPVTRETLRANQLAHRMPQWKRSIGTDGQSVTGPNGEILFEERALVQFEDPQALPFLCLQGVREYHAHPAHTGDSWWLHRGTGVGRLAYLLNALATYGIDCVQGVNFQIQMAGFAVHSVPE